MEKNSYEEFIEKIKEHAMRYYMNPDEETIKRIEEVIFDWYDGFKKEYEMNPEHWTISDMVVVL